MSDYSVIIRCYNEEEHIGRLFEGLESQNVSFRFEVILVDSGSTDRTREIAEQLLDAGADVLTLGNHIWDNKDILNDIDRDVFLRPANYPQGVPGHGVFRTELPDGTKIAVIHLLGRVFMSTVDCPFRVADEILKTVDPNETVIIDFHAEATSEKKALAVHLDGKASVIFGTHTHVQTADEQILPNGTAFISDVGMTGPHAGIIGMRRKEALKRFLQQTPVKYEVDRGDVKLQAMLIEVNRTSGKAVSVRRISLDVE